MTAKRFENPPGHGASARVRLTHSAVLSVFLAGCGGPAFEYAQVEGKLTLNKKLLAGAMVRFYPISDRKEQLPVATGFTDEAGLYFLTCRDKQPGALVGPNRVVVSWPSRDLREAGRGGQPLPPPSAQIPLHYTVASDTPLKVDVKGGETNIIDLHLED
jgi:hypothetical protein